MTKLSNVNEQPITILSLFFPLFPPFFFFEQKRWNFSVSVFFFLPRRPTLRAAGRLGKTLRLFFVSMPFNGIIIWHGSSYMNM